ncbi:MAG: M14 family zinc carboxypeptidase [Gammaproteobacteria bacterium]
MTVVTPLERHRHQRYSSSGEIAEYLSTLAARAPGVARLETIGYSARGRPLLALICDVRPRASRKLRVMMIGSQHGASEAAGCEALLLLARELLVGDLRSMLDDLGLVLIPNANPDGFDADSSRNGNDININRDYVLLTQPESCALDAAVIRFAPHVILDAHESASYKRNTLGRAGYLTDFEAQFDVANTPAIPAISRKYLQHRLLPALLCGVAQRGLRAQRYIREITALGQPLTHGGFTIRRLRNKAGIRGALTVLLETPMEPKAGAYATYRNIGMRVEKQRLCMQVFLQCLRVRAADICSVYASAKDQPAPPTLALNGRYVLNADSPEITVRLRERQTSSLVTMNFPDCRGMIAEDIVAIPKAYIVNAHTAAFAALLARQRIEFEVIRQAERRRLASRVFGVGATPDEICAASEYWEGDVAVVAGALRVPMAQTSARLIPLLLDARAASSVSRYPKFSRLIESGRPFFIYSETV